jgi:putative phosphonate metabolism protein
MRETNGMTMSGQQHAAFEWTARSRFAIYYAPSRQSSWWEAGCRWLERDPESGTKHAAPVIPALTARALDVPNLSRSPQRYGWHGTLVAPAHCASGAAPDEIVPRARAWARRQRPFDLAVEAAALDRFVAIRPATADGAAAMQALAADALHEFAPLRAMPSEADRRRRLEANLSARQRELLDRWGYPYVLDEFRFHMTLSDSIDSSDRQVLLDWWGTQVSALGPLRIDGAALFIEPEPGQPFVLAARLPFGDAQ